MNTDPFSLVQTRWFGLVWFGSFLGVLLSDFFILATPTQSPVVSFVLGGP